MVQKIEQLHGDSPAESKSYSECLKTETQEGNTRALTCSEENIPLEDTSNSWNHAKRVQLKATSNKIIYPKFEPVLWQANPYKDTFDVPKETIKPKKIPLPAIFLLIFSLLFTVAIGFYNYNGLNSDSDSTPNPHSSTDSKDLPGTPFESGKYAKGRWQVKETIWGDNYVDINYEITMDQGKLNEYNISAFSLDSALYPAPSNQSPYLPASSIATSETKTGWVRFYTKDDNITVILSFRSIALSAIKVTR